MKDKILRVLKSIEYLSEVSFTSEILYNNKLYKLILDAKMTYKEIQITIKICIPKDWDRNLIDIFVVNYTEIPYIPHIEKNGKICLFQLEGILVEKDLIGILCNCLQRMKEILTNGIDRKNVEDFINEFNSYVILSKNVKYAKLLSNIDKKFTNIKCAVKYKPKRIKNKTYNVETDNMLISDNENDFAMYNSRYTIYNGISLYIKSKDYIYPPDWRREVKIEFVNFLLNKCHSEEETIRKYLSEKGKYKFFIFTIEQPNGKIVNIGVRLDRYTFDQEKMAFLNNAKFSLLSIDSINPKQLCIRGGGDTELNSKKILVIGCGSIGGYLIEQIAKSGVKNIDVIDDDILKEVNIYRHVLGMEYVGRYKSEAICEYIKKNIPHINIVGTQTTIEEALEDGSIDLKKYDLIISAIGNHNTNRWLNEYIHEYNIESIIMYLWNEVLDIGNHILITNSQHVGCYECLFKLDDKDEIFDRTSYCKNGQNYTIQMQGCGSEYLPYSSTHSLRIVTYAIDFMKKIFYEGLESNILFSVKGTDYYFRKLGYVTSNRFNKQSDNVKILKGEIFKQNECKFCGKFQ